MIPIQKYIESKFKSLSLLDTNCFHDSQFWLQFKISTITRTPAVQ